MLEIAPENVLKKGRLQPGRIFFVDTEQGRIIEDEEIKHELVRRRPYRQWVADNRVRLKDVPPVEVVHRPNQETRFERQQAFGYTLEDLRLLLPPMITTGVEALGSMGDDSALAVLSDRPRLLFHYFKQLFAQVTNPPIDSLLERLVMSTLSTLGAERNLLSETAAACASSRTRAPDPDRRRARADPADLAPRLPGPHPAHPLQGGGRWRGSSRGARSALPRGVERRGRGRQPADPLRPGHLPRSRAHPLAPRHRRGASPPRARGDPNALRARRGDRRSTRGRTLRAADRLRRGRRESAPGLRDDRRSS